jgi:hypothetical protein
MKTRSTQSSPDQPEGFSAAPEPAPRFAGATDEEIDLSLLEDSLAKTPWERMQANDDALRFAESLRVAMEKRNAKLERTDPQTC